MKATVHNMRHEAMEPGDVYIGRAGHGKEGYFGNPWSEGMVVEGNILTRADAIERFRDYATHRIARDVEFKNKVKNLHGCRLFCFCAPKPCHGEVLRDLANELNTI